LADSLTGAGLSVHSTVLPPGESTKRLSQLNRLWRGWLEAGLDRGSTIVAFGGGVIGDLTGFAASTFLRGVAWVNLPTTLLAMVDASLGGKTGINLPQGKNLAGAFYPPRLVLADPELLQTLPIREWRSGMAEVVKHGIVGDPELFARCRDGLGAARAASREIVSRGMAVKIQMIQADPWEAGVRAALNFGHTIGHAVELVLGYRLRHGEAISIGMLAEARLAERIGLAQPGLADDLRAILAGLGLPTVIPASVSREALAAAAGFDKKRTANEVRFSLPRRVGEVVVGVKVDGWQRMLTEELG
jgi:3-dehydroquinate synthase